MKHMRSAALTLILTLAAVFCLSAAAFAGIFFPKSIKEIGEGAFEGVPLQKSFMIRSGTEKIGSRAFANTGVQLVWLPATLKEIAPDAFDKGTEFTCSPGTYAETWCEENGVDYDYIKPFLNTNKTELLYGETAVLSASPVFPGEPTSYIWETRERERFWTVIEGETGRTLEYTNTEGVGYAYFRVSAVWGDVCSVPSDPLGIDRYGDKLAFKPEKCEAINGDTVVLEWGFLGKDVDYVIWQWAPDAQNPDGGSWIPADSFEGGYRRTIYGLSPKTSYKFMIGILKDGATEIESEPITITTGDEKTEFRIHDFAVIGTSVQMSWEPIRNAVYDVYWGRTMDSLNLFSANRTATHYSAYGFPKETSYMQIKARIPNTGYVYASEILAITPTEDEPTVEIDECELKGDILHLGWTPLTGCTYSLYGSVDGGEEQTFFENSWNNFVDLGNFKKGEKWTFRVKATCGKWNTVSPDREVEITDPLNEVEYRALLIGQVSFPGEMYAPRGYGSVERIAEMLDNVKTPSHTYYSYIRRKDLNKQQILNAIEETFSTADENDVSLFFIATHGNVSNVGRYAGALCTVETPNKVYGELRVEELAEALGKIKGTKIVWLSACGTGAAIYDKDHLDEENVALPYTGEVDEDEWGDEWDEYEIDSGYYPGEMLNFETGELRLPGFQVMTAARHRFVGWGSNEENVSYFTKYLVDGVYGPDGSMPADLNGDGKVTQHELFLYIKATEEDPESGMDQDVQAYPMESDYVLFVK